MEVSKSKDFINLVHIKMLSQHCRQFVIFGIDVIPECDSSKRALTFSDPNRVNKVSSESVIIEQPMDICSPHLSIRGNGAVGT